MASFRVFQGFRVIGFGSLGVERLGFRAQDRIQGLGIWSFGVEVSEFRVPGF